MFGMVAFCFKTKKSSETVYLVPDKDKKKIGLKKTTVPVYAFVIADSSLSVNSVSTGNSMCCSSD